MNPEYEKKLEARIRRELDALGELPAPPALAGRILRLVDQRSAAPWYRRAWPTWSLPARVASLGVLLAAFGGLSFGAWALTQGGALQVLTGGWLADACALWRTVGVLGDIATNFISRLGSGVLVTAFAVVFSAGVICIGLGSACVRLALRPVSNRIES
jgi:hypothetical protein